MAGQFVNTIHKQTLDTLVDGLKSILNNPYYIWSNKSPTVCDYYRINKEASMLDEGSRLNYADTGHDSPLWYDLIKDFYIYGLEQIQIQMEHGEFGAEAGTISGEAVILPNTIIPYPGDFFTISYLKERFLFKIVDQSHDTMDNGNNIYKISYELSSNKEDDIEPNIKNTYHMVLGNVGTDLECIIRDEKYNLLSRIDFFTENLMELYRSYFYNERIQSFTFKYNVSYFYDPSMIEFIKKHHLLYSPGNQDYIHIDHVLPLQRSFPLEYKHTIFRCLENWDLNRARLYKTTGVATMITDKFSIFYTRPEQYFAMRYDNDTFLNEFYGNINIIKDEFIEGIENNIIYSDENAIYNIIIKIANNMDLTEEDIDTFMYMCDVLPNEIIFYAIPMTLYCIKRYGSELIKRAGNV